MGSTLNLSLTDELRAFVDGQSGDGTMYATPSEFVRDLIRNHKQQMEAERLRAGVIEGLQDATTGRVHRSKVVSATSSRRNVDKGEGEKSQSLSHSSSDSGSSGERARYD